MRSTARSRARLILRSFTSTAGTCCGIRATLPGQQWRSSALRCSIRPALIIRETRTRFGDAKLGYGWAIIEPVLHITLLSVTFAVLMHGQPPIGTQFFIFYYTGLVRYSGADGTSYKM